MQVNITYKEKPEDGYINYNINEIDDLDSTIADGECDSIKLNHLLEYYSLQDATNLFSLLVKKVHNGGEIIVVSANGYAICRNFINSQIDIVVLNELLYNDRKSCLTLPILINLFNRSGITIYRKTINNNQICLIGYKS